MRVLSNVLGENWVEVGALAREGLTNDGASGRRTVQQLLNDVLLSENLIVFTGLGTSLCVEQHGKRAAPTMNDLWEVISAEAGAKLESLKTEIGYSTPPAGDNIELFLSHCHLRQQLKPEAQIARFIERAENRIFEKCRFVARGDSLPHHESFLRKVARRSPRLPRLKLFTTNYDLCFEVAAANVRFTSIDGFSHGIPQEFDAQYFGYDLVSRDGRGTLPELIPNVFHLYKLHGSVDWEVRDDGTVMRAEKPARPLVVYPRHTKFEISYSQPFLEMMARFQAALRQPNTGLVVIGFGFNDQHLVQPILSAIRTNVGLRAVIIGPSVGNTSNPALKEVESLIVRGDSRLTLVESTFEDLVPVLPDLVAKTEDEAHRDRLKVTGPGE